MQATLVSITTGTSGVSESEAQRTADTYLATTLGIAYFADAGFYANGRWYFLIRMQHRDGEYTAGLGKLAVDVVTGEVIALTPAQVQEVHEASIVLAAQARAEVARDERGYLLQHQAKLRATEWLAENLTLHFSATDGLFVPLEQPIWQFSIRFRLPHLGEINPLGVIDVDALTGEVTPLTPKQLQVIEERAHAIIRHRTLAAAA